MFDPTDTSDTVAREAAFRELVDAWMLADDLRVARVTDLREHDRALVRLQDARARVRTLARQRQALGA